MREVAGVRSLPDPLLEQFSAFLTERAGLHFPRERHDELRRRLGDVAREFEQPDGEACIRWLMASALARDRIERLASHLTIGETYFLREPGLFRALGEHILPALMRARAADRRLRIWSAGCSTGEEPYSIAIVLDQLGEALRGWDVTLLATDINARLLRRAAEARYGEWSFRGVPPEIKEHYFARGADGQYALAECIRSRVTFSCLNLGEDAFPSLLTNTAAVDLIVCRNVLMYFAPEAMARASARLREALAADGWLALGAAEVALARPLGLRVVRLGDTTVLQKSGVAEEVQARPPLRASLPPRAPAPRPPRGAPQATREAVEETLAQQARGLANAGKLDAALACSRRALAADRLDPAAHYIHALIENEAGHRAEAAASLRRAIFLDRAFVMAHFALANLALATGKYAAARRHAANARALLARFSREDPVPEAEGMTAQRLARILDSMQEQADAGQ